MIPAAFPEGTDEPEDRFGIGEVLVRLRPEFADVTVSKIRFLESAGLVSPARTPSGYRRFSASDVQRLRYVLAAQRDQYLPLKVIKEQLAGTDPLTPPLGVTGAAPHLDLTRDELLDAASITADQLDQLESYGLVRCRGRNYDGDALAIARAAGQLAAYGVEARQLRPFRTAADREVGLVEQVVTPLARQQADAVAATMAALSVKLHAALVRAALRDLRGA